MWVKGNQFLLVKLLIFFIHKIIRNKDHSDIPLALALAFQQNYHTKFTPKNHPHEEN